jgi:hypothetical protein
MTHDPDAFLYPDILARFPLPEAEATRARLAATAAAILDRLPPTGTSADRRARTYLERLIAEAA